MSLCLLSRRRATAGKGDNLGQPALAAAEIARPLRFLLMPLDAALLVMPFAYDADTTAMVASLFCGICPILLSLHRGGNVISLVESPLSRTVLGRPDE